MNLSHLSSWASPNIFLCKKTSGKSSAFSKMSCVMVFTRRRRLTVALHYPTILSLCVAFYFNRRTWHSNNWNGKYSESFVKYLGRFSTVVHRIFLYNRKYYAFCWFVTCSGSPMAIVNYVCTLRSELALSEYIRWVDSGQNQQSSTISQIRKTFGTWLVQHQSFRFWKWNPQWSCSSLSVQAAPQKIWNDYLILILCAY